MTLFCGTEQDCPFRASICAQRAYRAALVYAALGYAVYPASATSMAHARGLGEYKEEGGKGGFHLATVSISRVHEWASFWNAPDVNVAVRTGAASRLVVLDLDVAGGTFAREPSGSVRLAPIERVGAASLAEWEQSFGMTIPRTAVSTTPGGGTHIWLRLPAEWAREVPKRIGWRAKLDLLWDRHSIKAPPSERGASAKKSAGVYAFRSGCPCQVPTVHFSVIAALADAPSAGQNRSGADASGASSWDAVRIDIPDLLEHGVPLGADGGQNGQFYRIACSLARSGLAEHDAIDVVERIASVSPLGDLSHPWTTSDIGWDHGYSPPRPGLVPRAYAFIRDADADIMAKADALLRRLQGG